MKSSLTLCLWLASIGAFGAVGREALPATCLVDQTAPDKVAMHAVSDGPLSTVSALLSALRERDLVIESDRQLEFRLVKAVLESAGLVDRVDAPPFSTAVVASEVQGPWPLSGGAVYLRAAAVGSDFPETFFAALARPPGEAAATLVLDLREAGGVAKPSDFATLPAFLTAEGKPCAVLVGRQTFGAAELLAAAMAASANVVLVGEATGGAPYPSMTLAISESLSVSLPVRPSAATPWPPQPMQPDLPVPEADENRFVAEGSPPTPDEIERDIALRRALDMLSMAAAMDLP